MGQNACTCLKKPNPKKRMAPQEITAHASLNNIVRENSLKGAIKDANQSKLENSSCKTKHSHSDNTESVDKPSEKEKGKELIATIFHQKVQLVETEKEKAAEQEESKRIERPSQEQNEEFLESLKVMSIKSEEFSKNQVSGPRIEMIRAYPAGMQTVFNLTKKTLNSSQSNPALTFANPFSSDQSYRYAIIGDFKRVSEGQSSWSLQDLPP